MDKLINRINNLLKSHHQTQPPVLYCVHGFGARRSIELDPLKTYFETRGHQVVCVDLYDQLNEQDTNPEEWFKRAQDGLSSLVEQKQRVWLVGFSMGGVIASKLATLYPVERVVLLAPAFDYVTLQTVKEVAESVARTIIKKPKINMSIYPPLPTSFTTAFRSIIATYKDSINEVDQPILFLHGSADEVIPVRSSENAYAKVPHEMKLLLIIHGLTHRILDDERLNQDILKIIDDFFNEKLLLESRSNTKLSD